METLNTVTKSGNTPSSPAPKAIATVVRPSLMQPDDKERAGLSVSTTVSSDGLYRFIERTAYRVTPFRREPNPLPGAGSDFCRPVPRTPSIMHRLSAGTINEPAPESDTTVAQTENRTYRLAEAVRSARRSHLRIATRDGVVDGDERALDMALQTIADELEWKAEDERAAIALIRTGRTKRTRGIVVDLFPQIGPEAA